MQSELVLFDESWEQGQNTLGKVDRRIQGLEVQELCDAMLRTDQFLFAVACSDFFAGH